MARSEQQFISLCKKQIEQKLSFGNGDGYTQRDLEILSTYIEERTGVIISLSTLKRLWKDDYKHSPQLATLNAIAVVLGHKDWQDFKLANRHIPYSSSRLLGWSVPIVSLLIVGAWIYSASSDFKNSTSKNSAHRSS